MSTSKNPRWASFLALALAAGVDIQNFKFQPEQVEIAAGDSVTWTNRDEELHAVVAEDGSFRSSGLDEAASYTLEFDKPGTYTYRCALHPHMVGKIVVR